MSDNETLVSPDGLSDQDVDMEDADEQQAPIPPASFEYLVATFRFQVEMQLGLLDFGDAEDRPEPNPELARHFIDMLAMIQDKTRGNLSLEEKLLLENTITELRFRFVQTTDKPAKA